MSNDEFAHVKALVRELHAPKKNVRRPKNMEKTGSADNLDEYPVDHHTYAHTLPSKDQHFQHNSFSIPSLVVTGIDNHDHPFGGGTRRFSNFSGFNLGLRRFSASFMVFLLLFVVFLFLICLWVFHCILLICLTVFFAFFIVAVFCTITRVIKVSMTDLLV